MKKVNFNTVYNDFGAKLPGKSEFFADPRNEVSRVMLRYRYKVDSDFRAYRRFEAEYNEFVSKLMASKKVKPTPTEKQDEAK